MCKLCKGLSPGIRQQLAPDAPVLSGVQLTLQQVGEVPGPVLPQNVTGELDLTQGFGPLDNGTAATRGYVPVPNTNMPLFSNDSQVGRWHLGTPSGLPGLESSLDWI